MQPPVHTRWPAKVVHRLRSLLFRNRLDQELAEELHFHLEQQIAEDIAAGMNPEDARASALRKLGGVEQLKEECRDSRGVRFIQDFVQDLRYGLRIVARTPVLSIIIVAILAIGIGSATAVYSLIDACLLHSKRYPVVDRWDVVHAYSPRQKMFVNYLSVPEILEVKRLTDIFEAVGAIRGDSFNLTGGDYPERILGTRVSSNGISMTGVAPILGRSFTEQEDRPGGPPVVVISAELWKRRFSSNPDILGQPIRLDGVAYTVIGVMPAHFDLWGGELWIPLQLNPSDSNRSDRRNWIVAVLRIGVSEQAANARLAVLAKQLEEQYGATMPGLGSARLEYHRGRHRQREAGAAGSRFRRGTVDSGFVRQCGRPPARTQHHADARNRPSAGARGGSTARPAADADRKPCALAQRRRAGHCRCVRVLTYARPFYP
jgi:hypothetical protein